MNITIRDVNNHAPKFVRNNYMTTIAENTAIGKWYCICFPFYVHKSISASSLDSAIGNCCANIAFISLRMGIKLTTSVHIMHSILWLVKIQGNLNTFANLIWFISSFRNSVYLQVQSWNMLMLPIWILELMLKFGEYFAFSSFYSLLISMYFISSLLTQSHRMDCSLYKISATSKMFIIWIICCYLKLQTPK